MLNPRRDRFYGLRQLFYFVSTVALLVVAIWARFTSNGLETAWRFLTRTPSSGNVEDLAPLRGALIGVLIAGVVAVVIMEATRRRYRGRNIPYGAIWLVIMTIISGLCGGAVYGHYWA